MLKSVKSAFCLLFLAFPIVAPTPLVQAQDSHESVEEKFKRMAPGTLPKDVVTSFHRRSVDSSLYPWRAIGRVNIGGRAHCSGSLIAENIVLTAAHCLYSKQTAKMVAPGIVHFVAGYSKGEQIAHSKVTRYTVGPKFDGHKGAAPANLPYDWALLVLEDAIGTEHGYLELHDNLKPLEKKPRIRPRVALETSNIVTAGYPGDRSHVLSLEENCEVERTAHRGHILVTSCLAIKGDSGGPILQKPSDRWVLIGIQTAATTVGRKHASLGLSALAFRDTFAAVIKQLAKEEASGKAALTSE